MNRTLTSPLAAERLVLAEDEGAAQGQAAMKADRRRGTNQIVNRFREPKITGLGGKDVRHTWFCGRQIWLYYQGRR